MDSCAQMFNKQKGRKTPKVIRSVSLEADVAKELDELAASENRSASNFIETMVKRDIKKSKQGRVSK